MSLCTLPVGGDGSVSLAGGVPVPANGGAAGRSSVVVGLRPEALELAGEGVQAEVEVVEEVGADAYVFCVTELGGERTKLVARADARRAPARGERVALRPLAAEAHLFDPESGARLGA
jgi:multiple sugar transport system ATP-binding protein